ncbi:hypothetical protein KY285_036244 [Solanum tuberosum]|nr:hypothetical protein KY285_036244 [Solanum tuberosum]
MALLKFWDPARLIFKFRDFELTLTLEEIGGFVNLPFQGRQMIVPHKQSSKKFLKSLGLKRNREMDCLDKGQWQKYHLRAFAIALLGFLVFPMKEGTISTTLGHVVRMLAQGGQNPAKTIVPMVLAEMISALSACINGKRYFEICNLLLQLWAVEHFYKIEDMIDILDGM